MAVRDILVIPDKRLRLKSEPVKAVDKALRALIDDMFETMYAAPGIGLAAIRRRAAARRHHGSREKRRAEAAASLHQSGSDLGFGREGNL